MNCDSAAAQFSSRGIIEIRFGDVWKPVCQSFINNYLYPFFETTCRHLGYGGVKESSFRRRRFSSCFSIRCFRDNDCFSSVRETNGNFGNFNFAITCQDQKWNIRLVNSFGGTKPESESRVEVYFQNAWSVVCDSDWTLSDSIVVCRELGYGQAISRKRRVPAVAGERKIFTYGSRCKGNKTALKDCNLSLSTIQRNDTCQEAVVVCEERESTQTQMFETLLYRIFRLSYRLVSLCWLLLYSVKICSKLRLYYLGKECTLLRSQPRQHYQFSRTCVFNDSSRRL